MKHYTAKHQIRLARLSNKESLTDRILYNNDRINFLKLMNQTTEIKKYKLSNKITKRELIKRYSK